MQVSTFGTPAELAGVSLEDTAVVVIDVLRMTSVATVAVAGGCAGLYAVADVDEARELAQAHGALLGGERGALRIEGFDFDNSPLAYTKERIAGRKLVMTTTNGTRAIAAAKGARRILLGAFINAQAVADALDAEQQVAFSCAGTYDRFTLEDALAAGCMVEKLRARHSAIQPDDMAIACEMLYMQAKDDLMGALSGAAHFERLKRLGMEDDLRFCLQEDVLDTVAGLGQDGAFHSIMRKQ